METKENNKNAYSRKLNGQYRLIDDKISSD